MELSPELIKELRERTGISIMECKKALEESGGDIEKAIEILRKRVLPELKKKWIGKQAKGWFMLTSILMAK